MHDDPNDLALTENEDTADLNSPADNVDPTASEIYFPKLFLLSTSLLRVRPAYLGVTFFVSLL